MNINSLTVDYKTLLKDQLKELGVINCLDLDKITNLHPKETTIYDVEDGTETMGKSPNENQENFKKSGRRGLNIYEGLALLRHNPKILKHHYIDLCGSRYDRADDVPSLYLSDGEPKLYWHSADYANPEWGAASSRDSGSSEVGDFGSLESRVSELEKFKEKVESILKL